MTATIVERIHRHISIDANNCWIWQGDRVNTGYGRVSFLGKMQLAHRVSYETFVGAIPDGFQIDHVCRVRACCNPEHLRPLTPRENVLHPESTAPTSINAAKTHCPRGHEYSDENTYSPPSRPSSRYCRTCRKSVAS